MVLDLMKDKNVNVRAKGMLMVRKETGYVLYIVLIP